MVTEGDYSKAKTTDVTTRSGSPTINNGIAVPFIIEGGSSDTTGPGRVQIDTSDAPVSSKDDMVLVDPSDDSALTYFFERFDPSNEFYSGWVYFSSLPRDGSTQIKLLFGDGPTGGNEESGRTTVFSGVSGLQLRPNLATSSGTIRDDSGNNYDSIDRSISGYEQTNSDFIGKAIRLDSSSNDYVNFGTGATKTMPTHLENQGELMILSHHYPTSAGKGGARVVQNDGNEPGNPWLKHGDGGGSGSDHHAWNGGTSLFGNIVDYNESVAHAARWDGSTEYLYEDGINEASVASYTVGNAVDQDTTIGANVEKLVNHYDGYVDEVQIFDQDRGDEFMVAWQEATPGGGEQLFSWNAAESTATLAQASKQSISLTPKDADVFSETDAQIEGAEAQRLDESFEGQNNGDYPDGWTDLKDSLGEIDSSYSAPGEGSYSFYHPDGGSAVELGPQAEYRLSQGENVTEFEFWYRETSSSTGGGVSIWNKNGDRVAGAYTDNPELNIFTGNGFEYEGTSTSPIEPNPIGQYDVWVKVTIFVDRYNNEMSVDFYDNSDGSTDSYGPFPIDLSSPIEKIKIENFNSPEITDDRSDLKEVNTTSFQMWVDGIKLRSSRGGKTSISLTPKDANGFSEIFSESTKQTISMSTKSASVLDGEVAEASKQSISVTPYDLDVFSESTATMEKIDMSVLPKVAETSNIPAPLIPFNKPRGKIKITESESGEEHKVIDSKDGSDNFLVGDVEIDGSVKSAVDGFSFTLANPGNRFDYISVDDEVEIFLGYNTPLVRVMRGLVTQVNREMGGEGSRITIEGQDYGQRLQQMIAAEVYLDESIGDIIRDLVLKYAPEIDTDAVQDPGETLESFRVAYDTLFDAIQKLSDRADYQFYVDNDKVLHFEPRGFEESGKRFTQGELIKEFSSSPNKKKLVNEAIIFGGKRSVRELDKKSGTGSKKIFETTFKPHDPEIIVNDETLQGGARGTTNIEEVDYVYDLDTREIEFSSAPASGTDNIQIRYSRKIPIQARVRDEDSVEEYGLYQKQETDQNITKKNEAESIAQSLVDEFRDPPIEADAKIVGVHELFAGQSVTFDVPEVGANDVTYPIIEISYRWGESGYEIDLTLNEEPRKIADILKELKDTVNRVQGFDSGALDLIRKLQAYSDDVDLGEALSIENRQINDSFILSHPDDQNSELGTAKLGDRRGTFNQLVSK